MCQGCARVIEVMGGPCLLRAHGLVWNHAVVPEGDSHYSRDVHTASGPRMPGEGRELFNI